MSQVRRAITQARINIFQAKLIAIEFSATGLIFGSMFGSWPIGLGVFFALVVGYAIPFVSLVIVLSYTGLWTVVFISIGHESGGMIGAVILGIIGSAIAVGLHVGGMIGLAESAS